MKKIAGLIAACLLISGLQYTQAAPHKRKKKKPTKKAMQQQVERSLKEKDFPRYRDSIQKGHGQKL
jgi:hypothetical protein